MNSGVAPAMFLSSAVGYVPGVALSVLFAIAATFLENQGLGPSLIIALVIGMAASFWVSAPTLKPGIDVAAKQLLAIGVALLGIRLSVQDLVAIGAAPAVIVVIAMASTIAVSYAGAKALGLSARVGILSGVSTAVCGASAAMATASVFPRDKNIERDTSLVVITVVAISAIAMVLYPLLVVSLGFSGAQAGVVLGGSIHNVPQAVAAGFTVSEEVGDLAALTKLFRVSLLAPIVILVSMAFVARSDAGAGKKVGVPWFVVVFAILVVIASVIEVPSSVRQATLDVSNWLLLIAIAAIGMSTSLVSLKSVGPKVVVLVVINSFVLLGILLGAVLLGFV